MYLFIYKFKYFLNHNDMLWSASYYCHFIEV